MNQLNKKLASRPAKQRGATAITMVSIIALVAFCAMILIRLFPVYMENFKVASHLKQVAADSKTKDMSDKEIIDTLLKRFQLDDVKNVTKEHIFFEDSKSGGLKIAIDYEVRTPAVGNVEMVVTFVEEAEVN